MRLPDLSNLDLAVTGIGVVNVVWTVVVVALVIVLRRLALREVHRRVDDPDVAYKARKTVAYTSAVVVVALLALIWVQPGGLSNVGTFLGLVSAGLAVALGDLIKNFAGWVYIISRRPFRVDDRIEVGTIAGDVIDLRIFRTTMLEIREWVEADQSTGRIVHVPNGVFLREAVKNFTQGFGYIWHELEVVVTFESNWEQAERLILGVMTDLTADVCDRARAEIRHASRDWKIRYSHFDAKVWVRAVDHGVKLTGRMLVPVRSRRGYDERAWRGVLLAFQAAPDVELAYPTIRTFVPQQAPGRPPSAAAPQSAVSTD